LDALLKKLDLKPFLICCFVGSHDSGCSPNIPLKKEVAGGGGGRDVGGRLSRDTIKGGGMGEHGLGSRFVGAAWCLGKRAHEKAFREWWRVSQSSCLFWERNNHFLQRS